MTFALDLSKAIEKAKDKAELAVRKIAIDLFNDVIMMSPVGNPDLWKYPKEGYVGGRFRANWNCSIGSPDTSTTESVDPSGSAATGRVTAVVLGYQLGEKSIYLCNSLPYAERLENGWSDQAPQGMVRLSIIETNNAISNV